MNPGNDPNFMEQQEMSLEDANLVHEICEMQIRFAEIYRNVNVLDITEEGVQVKCIDDLFLISEKVYICKRIKNGFRAECLVNGVKFFCVFHEVTNA